jgi:acetoin utilization protein AcuB
MDDVAVETLMRRPVVSAALATSTRQALELAREHRVHHLPILDGDVPVGLVCTCDLEEAPPSSEVSTLIQGPPLGIQSGRLALDALETMNANRVGSLLVLEGKRMVGIVTRSDLGHAGLPVRDDPRGFCSCCGALKHLREHPTGALCTECLGRSRPGPEYEVGGGD